MIADPADEPRALIGRPGSVAGARITTAREDTRCSGHRALHLHPLPTCRFAVRRARGQGARESLLHATQQPAAMHRRGVEAAHVVGIVVGAAEGVAGATAASAVRAPASSAMVPKPSRRRAAVLPCQSPSRVGSATPAASTNDGKFDQAAHPPQRGVGEGIRRGVAEPRDGCEGVRWWDVCAPKGVVAQIGGKSFIVAAVPAGASEIVRALSQRRRPPLTFSSSKRGTSPSLIRCQALRYRSAAGSVGTS